MKALLVTDIQNDFLPGGALPVPRGDEVVPVINRLMDEFDLVIACKDWHPEDHASFSKWPPHCIQETWGADFSPDLRLDKIEKVFLKGQNRDQEGYSAFEDTGLAEYLCEKDVDTLYIVGLATDYCVKHTAADATALGFSVHIIDEGCRAIG